MAEASQSATVPDPGQQTEQLDADENQQEPCHTEKVQTEQAASAENLEDLPAAVPRELPDAHTVFTDSDGRTVRRYRLPNIEIETWLGMWYHRVTDADTKTGVRVSDVRLSAFSTHTQVLETVSPWKATEAGGFGTWIVQQNSGQNAKFEVYVAACEVVGRKYSFDVDIAALNEEEEEKIGAAAAEMAKQALAEAKLRPSSTLRVRMTPMRARRSQAYPARSATAMPRLAESGPVTVPRSVAEEAAALLAQQLAAAGGDASKVLAAVDAAQAGRSGSQSQAERLKQLDEEALRRSEQRRQRLAERTPLRSRTETPLEVRTWRQSPAPTLNESSQSCPS